MEALDLELIKADLASPKPKRRMRHHVPALIAEVEALRDLLTSYSATTHVALRHKGTFQECEWLLCMAVRAALPSRPP